MALSKSTIAWHLGSMAAGGVAVINAAASHKIDLYAIFDQLQKVYGDLVTLGAMLLPVAALAAAAYRTYGMKNVPSASLMIVPTGDDPKEEPPTGHAVISRVGPNGGAERAVVKIVGALLLALIVFAPGGAHAQQKVVGFLVPNLFQAIGQWTTDDLDAAIKMADDNGDPIGSACWKVWQGAANVVKVHPIPLTAKLASDIEAARLVSLAIDRVRADPNCAGVWMYVQNKLGPLGLAIPGALKLGPLFGLP